MLVDGLDFSDDKMLVGRTFSYSRHPALPGRPELPAAAGEPAPKNAAGRAPTSATARWRTASDRGGENPHVNYEPSITGGLREAQYPTHDEQGPEITGRLTRKRIPRTNDYTQAGQRYLLMEHVGAATTWSRTSSTLISQAARPVQERMVWHFCLVEDDLGRRVGEGLGITLDDVKDLQPLQTRRSPTTSTPAWRTSATTAPATSRA